MNFYKTIRREVVLSGIGLHSSEKCCIRIEPAKLGTGIVFSTKQENIKVSSETLSGSSLGTNLIGATTEVRTVEHLLSAITALGITDLIIRTTKIEVPILDGSSAVFFNELMAAGIQNLGSYSKKRLTSQCLFELDSKSVLIRPRRDDKCIVRFQIAFDNKVVSAMPQTIEYEHSKVNYLNEIAYARTFGFKRDIEFLISQMLCLGGSLENAILIDEDAVINIGGLRFDNEIISHKVLDIIGDLSPIFNNFVGFEIIANKAGHTINNLFLRHFFKSLNK